jgi:hypothetical protein
MIVPMARAVTQPDGPSWALPLDSSGLDRRPGLLTAKALEAIGAMGLRCNRARGIPRRTAKG